MFRKLTPDDARIKALDEWIRMGGRLVLCVGSQADEVLAANSPLAAFAPGRLETIVTSRSDRRLGAFLRQFHARAAAEGGRKIRNSHARN